MRMLESEWQGGNPALGGYLEDYVKAQAVLQAKTNPSGMLQPFGAGLGEPKFLVDGSRFNGAWGRPQGDGPALRAIANMVYALELMDRGRTSFAKEKVWPVIQNDLSYVGQYWNTSGFDAWEEVSGSNFFTTQVQYRALAQGANLAKSFGVPCVACEAAPSILCFLNQAYWNGEFFTANINTATERSGLNALTILGPITVFDTSAPCDSPTLQPCHSKSLANFKVFTDVYRNSTFFPINNATEASHSPAGVALGRYPEDIYDGGNAWYLITLGAAEFLYDVVGQWSYQGFITVDETSLAFFQDLWPSVVPGTTYKRGGEGDPFDIMSEAAWEYADRFVAVVRAHMPSDGSMTEQFSKRDGQPMSARDLTWSYTAFLTMAERRAGHYENYWTQNVPAASSLPAVCPDTTVIGKFEPAVAAGAPNVTQKCQVPLAFFLNTTTYFGENMWLSGNVSELGSWNFKNAIPMSANGYQPDFPIWSTQVSMTPGAVVEYKYIRQENCNQPSIYEKAIHLFVVPDCPSHPGVIGELADVWTGPTGTPGKC